MKIRNIILILLIAIISLVTVGCANNDDAAALTKKIYIVNNDRIMGNFPLPKYVEGNRNAPITWISSNPNYVSVAEYPEWDDKFDRELYVKATVVLPEDEGIEVTLTATVKFGKQVAKRELLITVVPNDFLELTAVEAKKVAKDTNIQVKGTVVMAGEAGYIVKDSTGYIYAYLSKHGLKVGDIVEVRGQRDTYNYMPQIKAPISEKIGREPEGYDPYADLETKTISQIMANPYTDSEMFGNLYKISGMVNTTGDSDLPYSFSNPIVLNEKLTVTKYSDVDALAELKEKAGKYVDAIVMIYSYRANEYNLLYVTDSLEVKTFTYTEQNYTDIALQMLQQKYTGMLVTGDLALEEKSGMEGHLANVEWTSQNLEIVKNDGKVVLPETDVDVTLNIKVTLGDKTANGTVEITVKKLAVSPIASLIKMTPKAAADEKIIVLVEGVVVGYQYKGYWLADETGTMLIYLNTGVSAGTNAPLVGQVVQVKGGLTTYDEKNKFTSQISPIGTFTVLDKTAPTLPTPTELSFDTMFSHDIKTLDEAKLVAENYFGKVFTITGDLIQMSSDNFWKIQDPTNPNRWFRMNDLASNTAVVALKNNASPKRVTITVMVRDLYFINDTSGYGNFTPGCMGGTYFVNTDVVVVTP